MSHDADSEALLALSTEIAKAADTVIMRYEAFMRDPGDVETNHKLRVSIRTLRSLLAFSEPWQKRKQNKRAKRSLKRVVAETSRLRELDVLASEASKLEELSEPTARYCEGIADFERLRVLEELGRKVVRETLEQVNWDLHHVKWKGSLEGEEMRCALQASYGQLASQLQADLGQLDLGDYEAVHAVRKRAKQARYVAERLQDVLGEESIAIAKRMEAQQDRLGAICDAQVNVGLIEGILKRDDVPEQAREGLHQMLANARASLDC